MMCYRKVGDKGNDDVFIAKAVQTSAPKAREAEASLTSLPLVRLLLLGWPTPSLSRWRLPIPLAAVTNNATVSGNGLKLRRVGRLQRFVAVGGVELSVALEACKEWPQSR